MQFYETDARNRPFWCDVSTKIHAKETFDISKKKEKGKINRRSFLNVDTSLFILSKLSNQFLSVFPHPFFVVVVAKRQLYVLKNAGSDIPPSISIPLYHPFRLPLIPAPLLARFFGTDFNLQTSSFFFKYDRKLLFLLSLSSLRNATDAFLVFRQSMRLRSQSRLLASCRHGPAGR